MVQRVHYCHAGARDGRRASATIGLYHVTIHGDRALTQQLEIQRRTQRAANQSLDFNRSPALLATRRLAIGACVCRTWTPSLFSRNPSLAGIAQEWGNTFINRCRTQDMRVPEFRQTGAFCMQGKSRFECDIAERVVGAA